MEAIVHQLQQSCSSGGPFGRAYDWTKMHGKTGTTKTDHPDWLSNSSTKRRTDSNMHNYFTSSDPHRDIILS